MPAETDVLQFCAAAFKSVWALEVLLTLKRHPDICWAAGDLIKELRCSSGVIIDSLSNLSAARLVIEEARGYRYGTGDPRLDELTDGLQELYAVKPSVVIREIMTAPNMKLKILSDAFRIK